MNCEFKKDYNKPCSVVHLIKMETDILEGSVTGSSSNSLEQEKTEDMAKRRFASPFASDEENDNYSDNLNKWQLL